MLSPETLESYRKMTNAERFALSMQMTRDALPFLLGGSPEQVTRKFAYLRRENDARNKNMLETIGRTDPRPDDE